MKWRHCSSNPHKAVSLDGFLHNSHRCNGEALRRARLQIRFGVLGGILAIAYSALFFSVGYPTGGIITGVSGLVLLHIPWLIKQTGDLSFAGHIHAVTLLLGVTTLCVLDGGRGSSSFAWFVAIPVCALLVMKLQDAICWCLVTTLVVSGLIILDRRGIPFPRALDPSFAEHVADAASLGLLFFITFLVLLLEKGRMEAAVESRASSRKLETANRELKEVNRQKNEFLNIAAHDLKNPLSIICGYADLLRETESPSPKEVRNQAAEILRSGNYMLDIVRNILDVRTIEDGKNQLSKVRCPIRDMAEDLVLSYAPCADRKNISVTTSISGERTDAWGDPRASRQILDNLISNAIKYTPIGGNVLISLAREKDNLAFRIRDNGPGLTAKDQERLWGKFAKLSPKPTGGENTNGLGLWIVRRLAREMGGDSFCDSEPGKGSTFGVYFPLWTESCTEIKPKGVAPEEEDAKPAFDRLIADIEARSRMESGQSGRVEDDSDSVILPS